VNIGKYQTKILSPVPRYNPRRKQYYTIVAKNPQFRSGINNLIRRYGLKKSSVGSNRTSQMSNLGGGSQSVFVQQVSSYFGILMN
jgi:hypothetical protein